MSDQRPNPDQLLQQIKQQTEQSQRGKLKIFFGYAAGVGKTYAMLQAAIAAKRSGRDVVIGFVQPHGRKETESLLEGFATVPLRKLDHRGVELMEFDIDAAIQRKADLLIVDELAHTNAEGSKHSKRWQDVAELLESGTDVWTTLNVQHIESLNDLVGQITGIVVRETVPDSVFEMAEELELVDIAPEELQQRLKDGKVYLPAQAQQALRSFFQKSNLVALRELSLRQTTKRVHSDVELARKQRRGDATGSGSWSTTDRILVCVGPSPTTARVIRTAKRMASALDCPWTAVCVERAQSQGSSNAQVADNLRLAERLGAETVVLTGSQVAETILDFAQGLNVTKIFIGKTQQPRWRRFLGQGIVEQLLDKAGQMDVYVIQGQADEAVKAAPKYSSKSKLKWQPYVYSLGIVGVAFVIALLLRRIGADEANIIMTYLLGVAVVAFRLGSVPATVASVASVVLFDVAFVEPIGTVTVHDSQYILTFTIMLAVSLLISTLTARLRWQLEVGKDRERRTLSLNRLSKQLAAIAGDAFLVNAAGQHLQEMTGGEVAIYLCREGVESEPKVYFGARSSIVKHAVSSPAAHWVSQHDQVAGKGTDTLPNAEALFVPITGSTSTLGAIALACENMSTLLQSEQRLWLESCANQLALALERDRLSVEATDAKIHSETERLRSTLLSGLSHDLKTPLAVIAGASSTLQQMKNCDTETSQQLLTSINDEALRLNNLIENVLQISRIDSGSLQPNLQWHVFEEIVGAAVIRTKELLAPRHLTIQIPSDLPLVKCDGLLIDQVLQNLLENAAKYTPSDSTVDLAVRTGNRELVISIADDGPGIRAGTEHKVFERFYRQNTDVDASRGSGLGLAICRAIIDLHHGQISVKNRPQGGAEFSFTLPLMEPQPSLSLDCLAPS
ncbi:MAG: sensor histidine kinase KdpD [Pirellulales bacterium]